MRRAVFRQAGVISIFVVLSVLATPAYAQQSSIPIPDPSDPDIEISTSSLPYVYVDAVEVATDENNLITGTFTALSGEEKATISDIQYELFLLAKQPDSSLEDTILAGGEVVIDRYVAKDTFTLTPQETKQVSISYQAPQVPEGEYILRVQLRASTGREMGWGNATVTLKGADSFIVIQPQSVDVTAIDPFTRETKNTWAPREGPNVQPNAQLTLTAQLQSVGSELLTVIPSIGVTRDLLANQPTTTTTADSITIQPNEHKTVSIPIQAAAQPGVYEVLLTLNQNNQRVSGVAEFRYVVEGISASVVSHRIEQFPTTKGETAVIGFSLAGSADRSTQRSGTVEVAILDGNKIAGAVTVDVDTFDASGTATVPLREDICGDPRLRITLTANGGEILDTYETNVDVPVGCTVPGGVQSTRSNKTVGVVVALGAIVVVLVGLLVALRRKRKGLPPDDSSSPIQGPTTPPGSSGVVTSIVILLAVAFSLVLIANRTPADASHAEGHVQIKVMPDRLKSAIFVFINTPRHNQTLYSDTFAYEMRYEFAACGNDIGDALISVLVPPEGGHLGPSDYMPDYGRGAREHNESWIVLVDKVKRGSHGEQAGNLFNTILTHPSPLPDESTLLTVVAFKVRFRGYLGGSYFGTVYAYDYTWINFAPPTVTPSFTPTPSTTPSPAFSVTPTPSPTPTTPGTTECSDGIDNDGDTFVDCIEGNSDPGCYTDILDPSTCDPNDDDEYHVPEEDPGGFGETD